MRLNMLNKLGLTCVIAALVSSAPVHAANEFEYPELMVTPRASERVDSEASKESSRRLQTLLPIQVSALSTLAAGVFQLASPKLSTDVNGLDVKDKSGIAGIAVGGGWLALSTALAFAYQPYTTAHDELKGASAKSPRDQLKRERMAEESIDAAARLGTRLKWISFLTNAGTAGYLVTQAEKGSFSQVADGVAVAASLIPLVFRPHWEDVASDQREYKKKIYAPIASAGFIPDLASGTVVPGVSLSVRF